MCGILGILKTTPSNYKEQIRRGLKSITHRGPDGHGIWEDEKITLGHVRLKIIDLSKNGAQPMTNEEGNVVLSFNGEIYNFQELRQQLEHKHSFKSNTDTEVIIHGFEEWGTKMFEKIDGMFAIALWDGRRQELHLVRDRAGKKPLYYAQISEGLVFGSEMKALVATGLIGVKVSDYGLDQYLSFSYTPAPYTLLDGIYKLSQATHLTFKFVNGKLTTSETVYWMPPLTPEPISCNQAIGKIRWLLSAGVKKRLVSDVPLGAFLSGGLDSTLTTALMKQEMSEELKTFSIAFHENGEQYYSRLASEALGTDHHELFVDHTSIKDIQKIIWHCDDIIGDAAIIPTYYLAQHARKHVTVTLSGDGADELYAGYSKYKIMQLKSLYDCLPKFFRTPSTAIALKFIKNTDLQRKVASFLYATTNYASYDQLTTFFTDEEKSDVLTKAPSFNSCEYTKKFFNTPNSLLGIQHFDWYNRLPESFLMKVDRATMAHSLETRTPFLDTAHVDFAMRLPPQYKLRLLNEKWILKKSAQGLIPDIIRNRRKRGFNVPTQEWFNTELRDYTQQKLEGKHKEFSSPFIKKTIKNFSSSKRYYNRHLWTLLAYVEWKEVMDI